MKFKRRPEFCTVDAEQWDGKSYEKYAGDPDFFVSDTGTLNIITANGPVTCSVGDYVLYDAEGRPYPCKQSVFETTYEPALDEQRNWEVVWMQSLTGGEEILYYGLSHAEAVRKKMETEAIPHMRCPGCVYFVREMVRT